eukprot:s342_g24.t1
MNAAAQCLFGPICKVKSYWTLLHFEVFRKLMFPSVHPKLQDHGGGRWSSNHGKPTMETSSSFLGKHRSMGRALPSKASAVKRAHTRCGLQPSESGDVILKEVWLKLLAGLECGTPTKIITKWIK